MPTVLTLNLFINLTEQSSPRDNTDSFNYPEVALQIGLLILGYTAIIRSVKTVMLFTCLCYFAFGLMFAYEEVLKETRNVMYKSPVNFRADNPPSMLPLLPTYSKGEYVASVMAKYARIIGTLMFIAIGLALYSLRRIRIMRAIGNLRNDDAFKVVY